LFLNKLGKKGKGAGGACPFALFSQLIQKQKKSLY